MYHSAESYSARARREDIASITDAREPKRKKEARAKRQHRKLMRRHSKARTH